MYHTNVAPPTAAIRLGRAGAPLLLACLTGCSLLRPVDLPPPAPAFQPPPAWSTGQAARSSASDGAALAGWWRRFDDPLLEQLVTRALQANTSIASARASLQQARATRDAAAAALATAVVGSAQAQRSKLDGASTTNSYNLGFDASWEPDLFGANRHALAAGAATLQASAATLANVQVSVAAEVARSYIELRGIQARQVIARDNLASQQATQEITAWRVQAGLLTSLEQQQAITATEQAAAQLPVLESSRALLAHSLAVLCGQAPAALDDALAPPQAIPAGGAELALSLPAATLRQRPDVRAAEAQLEAARAKVAQADAARYPVLRLEGSLGLSGLGAGGSGAALLRTLLGSVAGNVFDGGASAAQLRLQRGALAQAQAGYLATLLTALQEVEDALAAQAADRLRLDHLRLAAAAADSAALLARQRYASGLVDFQTVLETQRALYTSQDGVATASANVGTDQVRLYKALGGGWQPDGGAAPMKGSTP
ncbi:efflux transporter outer membrane subunit [Duganella sp. LjRoot269]|jgi:NodT family efflux transporter outer membrane factor (OMF) lipoprotein|uniref:efflux transporter outer membrane subunit n=1 Tax=Duganella sp. LjRoot269 TaxID=3342305 RepID=UPI003ECFE7C3